MTRIALALCLTLLGAVAQAGSADTRFSQPEHYTDAGHGRDAVQVQATLSRHLQALAATGLPAGQTLKVVFTDIDLAGRVWPMARGGQDLRVLQGGADWPRLSLSFELSDGSRTLASGTDDLADLGYLLHRQSLRDRDALPYEQRLLSAWFARRFGPQP